MAGVAGSWEALATTLATASRLAALWTNLQGLGVGGLVAAEGDRLSLCRAVR